MSLQDPISNMLNHLKLAQLRKKKNIIIFYSLIKYSILNVLLKYKYIENFYTIFINSKKYIKIILKYFFNQKVITSLTRISKPSLRQYYKKNELQKLDNIGIYILSTSKGIISHYEAFKQNIGGELLCHIY